jgi:hypothetical protein
LLRDGLVYYSGSYTESAKLWSDELERRAEADGLYAQTSFWHPDNDIIHIVDPALVRLVSRLGRRYYPNPFYRTLWETLVVEDVRAAIEAEWGETLRAARRCADDGPTQRESVL